MFPLTNSYKRLARTFHHYLSDLFLRICIVLSPAMLCLQNVVSFLKHLIFQYEGTVCTSLLLLQSHNTLTGLEPLEKFHSLLHAQCHLEISATAASLLALLCNDTQTLNGSFIILIKLRRKHIGCLLSCYFKQILQFFYRKLENLI